MNLKINYLNAIKKNNNLLIICVMNKMRLHLHHEGNFLLDQQLIKMNDLF